MKRRDSPTIRSIVIADAREINGKTIRQIQEHIALKYSRTYDNQQITDALGALVDAGVVTLKGRGYIMSADILH